MPSIDMSYVAATLYFLGIYFHYVHVQTIFFLLERGDDMNKTSTMFRSLVWPMTVVTILWHDILGHEEEED